MTLSLAFSLCLFPLVSLLLCAPALSSPLCWAVSLATSLRLVAVFPTPLFSVRTLTVLMMQTCLPPVPCLVCLCVSMCGCVCVCVFVCECVCLCVRLFVSLRVSVCAFLGPIFNERTCACEHTRTHKRVCMFVCVYMPTCTRSLVEPCTCRTLSRAGSGRDIRLRYSRCCLCLTAEMSSPFITAVPNVCS